ncbi:MAG TPA: LacI family DNA-binding transcriptional regulator [Devosiaceae bacterium]|jgi:DNA-binding LacI/PurR family transcriptional regulator
MNARLRPPTIVDVAKRANVSAATVSYVLSGREELVRRIGSDTRQRITAAIAELGYVQNQIARQLRLRRTQRICVLLPQIGVPFVDNIAKDVEAVVQRRGYSSIVVVGRTFDMCRQLALEVEAGLADGIVADVEQFDSGELLELFEPLRKANKAVLLLHPSVDPGPFSTVRQARLPAFKAMLEHLHKSGRRHFAYIRHGQSDDAQRSQVLRAFLADKGLPPPRIVTGAETRDTAVAAALAMLDENVRPDALLIQSDFSAVAVIHALLRRGLSVPREIAVAGSGNAEEGRHCFPALTTIGPQRPSLETPVGHLLDEIEGKADATPQTFEIPWSMIDRESA